MKIKSFICLLFAMILLVSCSGPGKINPEDTVDSSDSGTESSDTTAAEIKVYSYTGSLASEDEIEKVGIVVNGEIVEGAEYVLESYKCIGYNEESKEYYYSTCGEVYDTMDYSDKIPDGIPVVRWSPDMKCVVKTGTSYSTYFRSGEKECAQSDIKDPGVYYFTVNVDFAGPLFDKSIQPEVGETYVIARRYVFALVVE